MFSICIIYLFRIKLLSYSCCSSTTSPWMRILDRMTKCSHKTLWRATFIIEKDDWKQSRYRHLQQKKINKEIDLKRDIFKQKKKQRKQAYKQKIIYLHILSRKISIEEITGIVEKRLRCSGWCLQLCFYNV